MCEEETGNRQIYCEQKEETSKEVQIAYLLTQLTHNKDEDVKITEFKDLKDRIRFRVKAELEDNIKIDSEVELDLGPGR